MADPTNDDAPDGGKLVYEMSDLSADEVATFSDLLTGLGLTHEFNKTGHLVVLASDEDAVETAIDAFETGTLGLETDEPDDVTDDTDETSTDAFETGILGLETDEPDGVADDTDETSTDAFEVGILGLETDEPDDVADDADEAAIDTFDTGTLGLQTGEPDDVADDTAETGIPDPSITEADIEFEDPGSDTDSDDGVHNLDKLKEAKVALDTWAAEWSVADDPYVQGLSRAIDEHRNITMWAALDPSEHLPDPEPKNGRLFGQLSQLLGFLRNVLVFVPVAITWWAISEATDAFGDYTEQLPEGQEVNFLNFWQNGYGVLEDRLLWVVGPKIQEVAIMDFLIIAVVVALTMASSSLAVASDRFSTRGDRLSAIERSRMVLTLVEALDAKRSASPESIAGTIADVLNDLVDASREINAAALQLENASGGVAGFSTQIDELSTRIEVFSQTMSQQVSDHLVQSIRGLEQSVDQLNNSVVGETARLINELVTGLGEISAQIEKTGVSVEFGTKSLRDDLDAIAQHRGQQRGPTP